VVLTAAICVLLTPASIAFARGGGWQPVQFNPLRRVLRRDDYSRGGGRQQGVLEAVHAGRRHHPAEVHRRSQDPLLDRRRGLGLGQRVRAGELFQLANGDLEFVNQGLNSYTFTEDQAAALGVPQISVSAGPIDVTAHSDGTVTEHMGNIIEDVCAEKT
jgi:hypothetical protein